MPNVPAYNVQLKKATVLYTDAGSAKHLFNLPGGSIVLRFYVDVDTAFNGTGTDLLDIGTDADPDHFANDIDLATVDQIPSDALVLGNVSSRPIEVWATYTDANSDASTGVAQVYCLYATAHR